MAKSEILATGLGIYNSVRGIMKQKILVLAYPGSGKTFLAENFENVSDLEFQHYRWDYGEHKNLPLEKLKGRKDLRTNNPDWPNNFFKLLDEELNKNNIILVPMATSLLERLEYLNSQNVRIIFAIPTRECFKDIIQTYKNRGNDEKFIENRKSDFEKFYDLVIKTKYEKIYIKKGEHLHEALQNIGIKFVKGKGYKNYF